MCFKKLIHPYLFQGRKKTNQYFEGWYYKLVSKDQLTEIAFIPGISLAKESHSFIQVFVSNNQTLSHTYMIYPIESFKYQDDPFEIHIEDNTFSLSDLSVSVVSKDLSVLGSIKIHHITPLKKTLLSPNIMGPFGYLNFMECYHGLVSMSSRITGSLVINDQLIDFNEAKLYIEKDWGKSFPRWYIWLQSNHFSNKDTSFMFSYAKIPFLGFHFKGLICVLNHQGNTYRFATYNFSKIRLEIVKPNEVIYTLKKGQITLEIHATQSKTKSLKSPRNGLMIENIKEGLSGTIHLKLYKKQVLIYEDTGLNAGIELMKPIHN